VYNDQISKSAEKKWLGRVAEYGCVVSRETNVVVHHCIGREGKQDKRYIGRIFVLPLAHRFHDNGDEPLNITHRRKAFIAHFGKRECDFFNLMCEELMLEEPLPFGDEELLAIMRTNR
jgi:hypothetical protein